jgi:hypothetical protein
MGNVFANGREVSAKADANQSIAAMPDICLSPPSPPAGPIPIPYPNFSQASDTSDGTTTVKIAGKEVGQKNKSNYKTSKGDEAATRTLGMGLVTHTIQGKTQHAAWSFDVKFEGENAIRHMDLTTHNHASEPMDTGSATMDVAGMAPALVHDPECAELEQQNKDAAQNDTKTGKVESGQVLTTGKINGTPVKAATPEYQMIKGSKSSGYVKPKPPVGEVREKGRIKQKGSAPTIACSSKPYSPGKPGSGDASTHTEGKIVEQAFKQGAQNVTMRINWNDNGKTREDPCPLCKRTLCVAMKECDMKITLCQTNDKGELKKEDASKYCK